MTSILLSSSLLILVILLARWLSGNRIPHRVRYALWLLVAIRLLIPFDIPVSTFSVSSYTQTHIDASVSQVTQQPITGPSYEAVYADVRQELQALSPGIEPVQLEQLAAAETQQRITVPTLGEVLRIFWTAGICVTALWFLIVNLRFSRRVSTGSRPVLVEGCPLPVQINDRLCSPCLLGLFRPVIYITPACTLTDEDLQNVCAHELTHWKHRDTWWALVRCVCLCVYWFHPLVWVAAILSRRDCELACDEGALKVLGEDRHLSYGRTLLNIVSANSHPGSLLHTATSMNESKKQLKQRIRFIASHPKRSIAAIAVLILVITVAVGCTFTRAKESAATAPQPSVSETQPTTTLPDPTVPSQTQPTEPLVYSSYLTELSDTNFICIALPQLDNGQMHAAVLSEVNNRLEALFEGTAQAVHSDTPVSVEDVAKYQRSLTLDYEITYQTDNLVSIVFQGMYNASDAAHPTNILFSVNLSPLLGNRIYLRKLYSIDQALYQDFCTNATQALLSQTGGQWPEGWDNSRDFLFSWGYFQLGMYQERDFSWYCTPEGITVSYPVPHALGDHQEVTLPFSCFRSPDTQLHPLYRTILSDYRRMVDYRLSSRYLGGTLPEISSTLQDALDTPPMTLSENYYLLSTRLSFMLAEADHYGSSLTPDSFGYALWDMNGDGTPELFWLRDDGYILAVFTIYQDELLVLDAFYSRYDAWITEDFRLATRISGGASSTKILVYDLSDTGDMLTVIRGVSIDLLGPPQNEIVYHEISGCEVILITEDQFYTRCEELTPQVPVSDCAAFHSLYEGVVPSNSIIQRYNETNHYYTLTDEEAQQLLMLFQSEGRQSADFPKEDADCSIHLGGVYVYNYHSKSGIITVDVIASYTQYIEQAKPLCWKLSESDWIFVNNLLTKYIDLPFAITDVAHPTLNLETLKDLAATYGKDLDWEHFSAYYSEDIGSGAYILRYPISNSFYCLLIGGYSTDYPPEYIRLVLNTDSSQFIDIRYEDIDSFLID